VLLTDAAYAQQTTNPKLIRYRMVKVTPDAGDCSTRAEPIGIGVQSVLNELANKGGVQ